MTIELSSKRESLAKAVVVAEGQLAALEAEIQALWPQAAMQQGLTRPWASLWSANSIKLIDGFDTCE